MEKGKEYYGTRFSVNTIREAFDLFLKTSEGDQKRAKIWSLHIDGTSWSYDNVYEWYADYPKANYFHFYNNPKSNYAFQILSTGFVSGYSYRNTGVKVQMSNRAEIESVFQIFERDLSQSTITIESTTEPVQPIKVFIGHGHDPQWRDLKDHLHDQHGLEVVAYEVGPRAGLTIKEVLENMLNESSIAFLVLTGEDMTTDGEIHARENVIHEVGLFQGRLGFKRAIVLLEKGCHEFSNINGVNQIRFSKGNIKEVYGDVLATIKREFVQ